MTMQYGTVQKPCCFCFLSSSHQSPSPSLPSRFPFYTSMTSRSRLIIRSSPSPTSMNSSILDPNTSESLDTSEITKLRSKENSKDFSVLDSSDLPSHETSETRTKHKEEEEEEEEEDIISAQQTMLTALQERRTEEAWRIYELLMRKTSLQKKAKQTIGIEYSVCLSRLVSQLSYAGTPSSLTRAQKIVASLQRRGAVDLLDCNCLGLLAMATAKAGAAHYSASVLRLMLRLDLSPHVKAWSAVVSKLGKNKEDAPLALRLFDDICSLVEAQSSDGSSNTCSMRPDTGAFNAALNACANANLVEKAHQIFGDLAKFDLKPDVLTFNILIKLYAMANNREKLCTIFDQMEEAGVKPCFSTMHSLVAAFVGLDDLQTAVLIVQALREEDDIGSILIARMRECTESGEAPMAEDVIDDSNAMDEEAAIVEYALDEKAPMATNAINEAPTKTTSSRYEGTDVRKITLETGGSRTWQTKTPMENRSSGTIQSSTSMSSMRNVESNVKPRQKFGFKPDTRMYTILMKGYMQKGRLKDVMQILNVMQSQEDINIRPNEVSYTTAISAFVDLGLLDEARDILLQMSAQNVPANVVTYNVLLKGYSKARQIPKGRLLLEDMKKALIQPDVVSYNTLIDGYISIDDSVSALALFTEMRNAGIAPSRVSYTMLIKAFGNNNQPQLGAKVFEEMEQDPRIKVDTIAWNTLIECYSKSGDVGGAKESFRRMKECGFVPTIATYGSLVKAFSVGKKAGEALVLWNEIKEHLESSGDEKMPKLEPDAGLLDGLVDICVREGFFLKALEILACMEKHKIPADRIKYKRMFVELHSKLYTSKYTSQSRRDRTSDPRRAAEAFKFWVGLPNNYYASDWSP